MCLMVELILFWGTPVWKEFTIDLEMVDAFALNQVDVLDIPLILPSM